MAAEAVGSGALSAGLVPLDPDSLADLEKGWNHLVLAGCVQLLVWGVNIFPRQPKSSGKGQVGIAGFLGCRGTVGSPFCG